MAACNSSSHGFVMSGNDLSGRLFPKVSYVQRISFPFDSGTASQVGNMSSSNYRCAGTDNIDFISLFV